MKNLFVTLLSIVLMVSLSFGCRKKSNPTAMVVPEDPKSYISKMDGMRIWNGTLFHSYFHDNGLHLSPTIYEGTTDVSVTFQINVINTYSIAAFADTFIYATGDTLSKTIVFFSGTWNEDTIKYYYSRDSIYYYHRYNENLWPNDTTEIKKLHTP